MKRIKEVIVVEGKDDTAAIHRAVDADTIETRGSAISKATLRLIQRLAKQRGIIIFTDPDYSGEQIRKIVARAVPNAKHAFVPRDKAVPKNRHGSLGVEHATPQVIRESLAHAYPASVQAKTQIDVDFLIRSGLIGGHGAKQRRLKLCQLLNIGYVNGKQLPRRLRMFGIQKSQVQKELQKLGTEARYGK